MGFGYAIFFLDGLNTGKDILNPFKTIFRTLAAMRS